MERHRVRSFDWKSIPLIAHFCVSRYMSCLPSALKSFSRSPLVLRKFSLYFKDLLQVANNKRSMQSSSMPAAQASNALGAAFAGSGFSTPTPHGDSARPYGNPQSISMLHNSVSMAGKAIVGARWLALKFPLCGALWQLVAAVNPRHCQM